MKTLEFKIKLTKAQQSVVESWFPELKKLWNLGLYALEEYDRFAYGYDKETKSHRPCCPLPWEWTKQNPNPEQAFSKNYFPNGWTYSRILDGASRWYQKQMKEHLVPAPAEVKNTRGWHCEDGGSGYSCPLPQQYRKLWIESSNGMGLSAITSNGFLDSLPIEYPGLYKNTEGIKAVGSKYRYGLLRGLATSWQEYLKSRYGNGGKVKRGKPLYKRYRDKIQTIVNCNPPKPTTKKPAITIVTGQDSLKVANLGEIEVIGLWRRWKNSDGTIPVVCTYKITKKPSGWYIHLTGDIKRSRRSLKNLKPAIGIDPGIVNWITLSDGTTYNNPQWYRDREAKIIKKQQQIDAKLDHTLILWLNHSKRVVEDISAIIPIAYDKAKALMRAKSPKEIVEIIGSSRYQRLRHSAVLASNRVKKLRLEIAKLREKEVRARNAHNHKHSTWLTRKHPVIVCEDGVQKEGLRHRPEAKTDENGHYTHNNASAKAGLTKSLSDAGHGDFIAKCESKAKERDRVFVRYPARFTTQQCPVCDHKQKVDVNYPGQVIECEECGYIAGRDQRPGILMLVQTYEQGLVSLDDLDDVVKDAIALRNARMDISEKEGDCEKR